MAAHSSSNNSEAAKSEVQRQVTEFIVEPLCAVFDELYAMSQQQDGRLLTFQMHLRAIPKWSAVTVTKWVTKVLSACDCFEELVTALFLSHIKLLSSIRLGHATLKVKIPRNEKFIHAVMILAAKEFYENPRTFRQKAHAEKAKVLAYALNKTVRDMLPMKDLLQEYLAQKQPDPAMKKKHDASPPIEEEDDVRVEPASETVDSESLQLADIANERTASPVEGDGAVSSAAAVAAATADGSGASSHDDDGSSGFVQEIKHIDIGDVKLSQQQTSLLVSSSSSDAAEDDAAAAAAAAAAAGTSGLLEEQTDLVSSPQATAAAAEQYVFPPAPPSAGNTGVSEQQDVDGYSADQQQQQPLSTEEVLLDDILLNHTTTVVHSPAAAAAAAAAGASKTKRHSSAFFSDAEV